jgi:G3E family GTPase
MFESGRRWLEAAATLDAAHVRRERRRRVAIVRNVLKSARIAIDDWEGASFVLRSPTGRTEIVDNLFDLWRKAASLGHRSLDPLSEMPSDEHEESASCDRPRQEPPPVDTQETAPARAPAGWNEVAADAYCGPVALRIPLHVLTGFLGSGKTTLLNRMLRDPALADSAVLINEFGAVAIDHHLVERIEPGDALDVIVLKGGCACCALRGDLVAALRELYARRADGTLPQFRRVVLETTGLADPAPVLFTLASDPALRHKFAAGAVTATVDAMHGAAQATRYPEWRKQVAIADRLVVTKTDLAETAEAVALFALLAHMNPAAQIVDGPSVADLPNLLTGARTLSPVRQTKLPDHELGRGAQGNGHAHAADHTHDIVSVSIALEKPIEWSAFAVWLTLLLHSHGDRIMRFKALLRVAGWPGLVALDGVHHLIHPPTHLRERRDASEASQLVFIAQGLQVSRVARSLRRFLTSTAGAGARQDASAATSLPVSPAAGQ